MVPDPDLLRAVLVEAQRLGFIGAGDLEPHIELSLGLGTVVEDWPRVALDLGSGGGLPGLPLAITHPQTDWILLEGSARRGQFLENAISRLGLQPRVRAMVGRAEEVGRGPLRGAIPLVFARSFGRPAVTAECAAPLLELGGQLIVSEPPGESEPGRWDPAGLARVGLQADRRTASPYAVQVLVQVERCPDGFPRRTGIPSKRPLF